MKLTKKIKNKIKSLIIMALVVSQLLPNSSISAFAEDPAAQLTPFTIQDGVLSAVDSSLLTDTTIVIPEGVTTIGESAFEGINLDGKTLQFPSTLTTIGDRAFYGTSQGGQVTILNNTLNVTHIGNHAFQKSGLTELTISGFSYIGEYAFAENKLVTLTLITTDEATPAVIEQHAFSSNLLTTLNMNTVNVSTIKNSTYAQNKLSSVYLPNSVTTIETEAFRANELVDLTVGPNTTIAKNSFLDNNRFVKILIPEDTSISLYEKADDGFGFVTNPVSVVVNHYKENTEEAVKTQEILGDDLSSPNIFAMNVPSVYVASPIGKWEPLQTETQFTPDREGYEITVYYRLIDKTPKLTGTALSVTQNQVVTREDLLATVELTDYLGQPLPKDSIVLNPETLNTGIVGPSLMSYSYTDEDGNVAVLQLSHIVGLDFPEVELGNGYQVKDFKFCTHPFTIPTSPQKVIEGSYVCGFSEHFKNTQKFTTRSTHVKLPTFDLQGRPVVGINAEGHPSSDTELVFGLDQSLITNIDIPDSYLYFDNLHDTKMNNKEIRFSNKLKYAGQLGDSIANQQGRRLNFDFTNATSLKVISENFAKNIAGPYRFKPELDFSATQLEIIGGTAFYNYDVGNKVKFPETLKTIGPSAFMSSNLTKQLEIPDSVSQIGDSAFMNNNVSYLKLPNNSQYTVITRDSFKDVFYDQTVPYEENVSTIDIPLLKEEDNFVLNIPSGVERIESGAFDDFKGNIAIHFEDNNVMTYIGDRAFAIKNVSNLQYMGLEFNRSVHYTNLDARVGNSNENYIFYYTKNERDRSYTDVPLVSNSHSLGLLNDYKYLFRVGQIDYANPDFYILEPCSLDRLAQMDNDEYGYVESFECQQGYNDKKISDFNGLALGSYRRHLDPHLENLARKYYFHNTIGDSHGYDVLVHLNLQYPTGNFSGRAFANDYYYSDHQLVNSGSDVEFSHYFSNFGKHTGNILLNLPNSIKEIGRQAFFGYVNKNNKLPKYIETIGDEAFVGTYSDYHNEKFIFPENLSLVGKNSINGITQGYDTLVFRKTFDTSVLNHKFTYNELWKQFDTDAVSYNFLNDNKHRKIDVQGDYGLTSIYKQADKDFAEDVTEITGVIDFIPSSWERIIEGDTMKVVIPNKITRLDPIVLDEHFLDFFKKINPTIKRIYLVTEDPTNPNNLTSSYSNPDILSQPGLTSYRLMINPIPVSFSFKDKDSNEVISPDISLYLPDGYTINFSSTINEHNFPEGGTTGTIAVPEIFGYVRETNVPQNNNISFNNNKFDFRYRKLSEDEFNRLKKWTLDFSTVKTNRDILTDFSIVKINVDTSGIHGALRNGSIEVKVPKEVDFNDFLTQIKKVTNPNIQTISKKDDNTVKILLNNNVPSGTTFGFEFLVRFNRNSTPMNTNFTLEAFLLENNKYVNRDITQVSGKYTSPIMGSYLYEVVEKGIVGEVDGKYYGDDTTKVKHKFYVQNINRNLESYEFTIELPKYKSVAGDRVAILDETINEGWINNGNGTITYRQPVNERNYIKLPDVILTYPGIQLNTFHSIKKAELTLVPFNKPATESVMKVKTIDSFTILHQPQPTGNVYGKDGHSLYKQGGESFFLNVLEERNELQMWPIGLYARGEDRKNVSIVDHTLDNRLYYHSVRIASDNLINTGILKLYKGDSIIYQTEITKDYIELPEGLARKATSLEVLRPGILKIDNNIAFTVYTKLRDPERKLDLDVESPQFENSISAYYDGWKVGDDKDSVFVRKFEERVYVTMSAYVNGIPSGDTPITTSDGLEFSVGIKTPVLQTAANIVSPVYSPIKKARFYVSIPEDIKIEKVVPYDKYKNKITIIRPEENPNIVIVEADEDIKIDYQEEKVFKVIGKLSNSMPINNLDAEVYLSSTDDITKLNKKPSPFHNDIISLSHANAGLNTLQSFSIGSTKGIRKYISSGGGWINTSIVINDEIPADDSIIPANNIPKPMPMPKPKPFPGGDQSGNETLLNRYVVPKNNPFTYKIETPLYTPIEYSLALINHTDTRKSGVVLLDILPQKDDKYIVRTEHNGVLSRQPRGSQFSEGAIEYVIEQMTGKFTMKFYNSDDVIDIPDTMSTKDWFNSIKGQLLDYPEANVKAIALVMNDGEFLEPNEQVSVIIKTYGVWPEDSSTPQDLYGKSSFNTFAWMSDDMSEFIEPNRVEHVITPSLGELSIIKEDPDGNWLAGAEFGIYNMNDELIAKYTTSAGFTQTIEVPIQDFYVKELKAPKGYALNPKKFEYKADKFVDEGLQAPSAKLTFVNYPEPMKIQPVLGNLYVYKTGPRKEFLDGVEFEVTNTKTNKVYRAYTINGVATLTNIPSGIYTVKEISTLGNLTLDPTVKTITLKGRVVGKESEYSQELETLVWDGTGFDALAPVTYHKAWEAAVHFKNESAQFDVYKIGMIDKNVQDNGETKKLSEVIDIATVNKNSGAVLKYGASFSLREDGQQTKKFESISGFATFKNVDPTKTYYILEENAPYGYRKYTKEIKITFDENYNLLINDKLPKYAHLYVPNFKEPVQTNYNVYKVDGITNRGLGGAEITIYSKEDDRVIAVKTTPTNGNAVFEFNKDLNGEEPVSGEFYMKETKAPAGYLIDNPDKKYFFTISPYDTNYPNNRIKNYPIQLNVHKYTVVKEGMTLSEAERLKLKHANSVIKKTGTTYSLEKPLPNAEFTLKEDLGNGQYRDVKTLKSGLNGNLVFSGDYIDSTKKYIIEETKAPIGYARDKTKRLVIWEELTNGSITYRVDNRTLSGQFSLLKYDKHTGVKLSNAKFTLEYLDNPHQSWSLTTDNNGAVSLVNLPLGDYKLKETKAPTGYSLSTEEINFTISEDNLNKQVQFQNSQNKKSIKITKKNQEGALLQDVEFQLLDENGLVLQTKTTDESGIILFENLDPAIYQVKETKTLPGYSLISKPLIVDLTTATENVTTQVIVNAKEIRIIPDTGTLGSLPNIIVGALVLGILILINERRKRAILQK